VSRAVGKLKWCIKGAKVSGFMVEIQRVFLCSPVIMAPTVSLWPMRQHLSRTNPLGSQGVGETDR
jgi:hypothetical protein